VAELSLNSSLAGRKPLTSATAPAAASGSVEGLDSPCLLIDLQHNLQMSSEGEQVTCKTGICRSAANKEEPIP